ncbi:hypothetical protein CMV_020048 [Castanea mollissima]|uniref:eRF1/Pelota-like N-terminal domain-containing protein n=1 Tax=Castanea mollissima TaxID=60419 RepID=A0A8J4QIK3_9ROSI|nr:hypothetical protein CMV_020048 [Castanea mollissima]
MLYNLILPGDTFATTSSRKIHHDSGKITTARVKLNLKITITAVDYDKVSSTVRVQRKNIKVNEHVPTGSFHTLTLEKNKEFVLTKKVWDSVAVDTLREGCSMASSAGLAVVLMQQQGLAHMFLVGKRVTTLCVKINGSTSNSNSNKFFENVFRAFVRHVDFSTIRCVIIGSPGCVKNEFRGYLLSKARRLKMKSIEDNKLHIVVATTSLSNTHNLSEVLNDNAVINLIREKNVVPEIRVFKEFLDMVTRAFEIETRHKYVGLVKSVKKAGSKVFVLLSMHVSGEELAKLTDIAAILRFPLPDLDVRAMQC